MLLHEELTEKIIGHFYETYNELGHGFLESVYKNALTLVLTNAGHHVQSEAPIPVWFRGVDVGHFRADLVVDNLVILELKVARVIDKTQEAQLYNYLRATKFEVGLLLNFGERPSFRRIVYSNESKKIRVHLRSSAVGSS